MTPSFPDHPSAHSCASSAIVHSMQSFFGTDKVPFSAFSIRTRTTRSFERLSDALKEVIDARVWGGIHFRTADVQGAVLGKKVAHWLEKNYFQPAAGKSGLYRHSGGRACGRCITTEVVIGAAGYGARR